MSRKIIAADPDADPEKDAITAPVGALTPPFADPDAAPRRTSRFRIPMALD